MVTNRGNVIAERLDWLFQNILHPDGREYKYIEIQNKTEKLGRKVTASYIGKLRRGEQENPAWDVVSVLAQVFNVPITFFYQQQMTEEELERIKIATVLQEEKVGEIALKARDLSPAQRKTILDVIDGMVDAKRS